jgi:hypothetical protein
MENNTDDKILVEPADLELVINLNQLNKELLDQPLKYKKWTNLKAEANRVAKFLKLELKEREALAILKLSSRKMTVDQRSAEVSLDPRVQEVQRKLIEAEEVAERFEGVVRAFYQRHEMLKDLSANKRKELID